MRILVDNFISPVSSMGSPGIDELRWLKPVRPGDRLHARVTVVDSRRSTSRPDRGIIHFHQEALNQDDRGGVVHARHGHVQVPPRLEAKGSNPSCHPSQSLQDRPGPQSGQLHAADAVEPAELVGRGLPRPSRGHPRPPAPDLGRSARTLAPAGQRAGQPRHRRRRYGVRHPAQHAADDRGAFWRADDRRGAQHHQHAAGRGHSGVHAGSLRREGADHRSRIFRRWSGRPWRCCRRPASPCPSWSMSTIRFSRGPAS